MDLVLCAGGDGTVNEVLNGMVGSTIPLGVLPAGTANVFSLETRLGKSAQHAAEQLHEFEPVRISVGLARNADGTPRRHFLCMAGAGFDARIVSNVNHSLKRVIGKGSYWFAAMKTFASPLSEMHASHGGNGQQKCSFVLISNVRKYGGELEVARQASLLKSDFNVYIFEGRNPLRYLKYFTGVLFQNTHTLSGVTAIDSQALTLAPVGDEVVYLQLDGEEAGTLPATIETVPDAVTILLPPKYLAKERARWTI